MRAQPPWMRGGSVRLTFKRMAEELKTSSPSPELARRLRDEEGEGVEPVLADLLTRTSWSRRKSSAICATLQSVQRTASSMGSPAV